MRRDLRCVILSRLLNEISGLPAMDLEVATDGIRLSMYDRETITGDVYLEPKIPSYGSPWRKCRQRVVHVRHSPIAGLRNRSDNVLHLPGEPQILISRASHWNQNISKMYFPRNTQEPCQHALIAPVLRRDHRGCHRVVECPANVVICALPNASSSQNSELSGVCCTT